MITNLGETGRQYFNTLSPVIIVSWWHLNLSVSGIHSAMTSECNTLVQYSVFSHKERQSAFNLKPTVAVMHPLEHVSSRLFNLLVWLNKFKNRLEISESCRDRLPWYARTYSKQLGVLGSNTERCISSVACENIVESQATNSFFRKVPCWC